MEQVEARQKARDMGGIAVEARPKPGGRWLVGGWPNASGSTWIVTDIHMKTVLAA